MRGQKGLITVAEELIHNAEAWNSYLGGMYQDEVEEVRMKEARAIVYFALKAHDFNKAIKYSHFVNLDHLRAWYSKLTIHLLRFFARINNPPQ